MNRATTLGAWRLALVCVNIVAGARMGAAQQLLVPMDDAQQNHLKAYGLTYAALKAGLPVPEHPRSASEATLVSPPDDLHRNAAGDFFLMERRHWLDLRGYPELYTHAHIDAIMCWIAASAGLRQVILPPGCRLYHQAHERGAHASFPQTDWRVWYERYLEATRDKRRMVVNDAGWGLAREELREWTGGPRRALVACDPRALPC